MALRRTTRQLASPKAISKRQADQFLEERSSQKAEVNQLKNLVNSESWQYAKGVARQILESYATVPPRNETEKVRWEVYCIVRFALEAFIQVIETAAKTGILMLPRPQETSSNYANNGSDRKD
jgi:hypothetical protein